MNGEVNGTMETPMDTSIPGSPDKLQNDRKVASEGCENATDPCDNSNNTADSNHLNVENSNEGAVDSEEEHLENSNSNENQKVMLQESIDVPENANSNNSLTENHCGNSNESYAESMNSSQTKSEAVDQQMHDIDGEPEKEINKIISIEPQSSERVSDQNTFIDFIAFIDLPFQTSKIN